MGASHTLLMDIQKPSAPSLKYRLLSILLFIPWVLFAFWHAYQHRNLSYLKHRLGFVKRQKADIWLHASSVGEVNLIRTLSIELAKEHSILVTTFTATGMRNAQRIFKNTGINVSVIPIDLFIPITSFFSAVSPKISLVAETEIWPELLFQAKKHQSELLHINARLSNKTLKTSGFKQEILKQALRNFSHHYVRNEVDANNFASLEVDQKKISVMGNLKFSQFNQIEDKIKEEITRPYVLLASSHDNEEQLITDFWVGLKTPPLLVIAPRHPDRAKVIIAHLKTLNVNYSVRSHQQPITTDTQVYLADTFGEMGLWFSHCQFVIMGGSFVDIGGHNLLEPAFFERCVVTGPSDTNIKEDIEFLKQHDGVIQVQSVDELKSCVNQLLENEEEIKMIGMNSKLAVSQQQTIIPDYVTAIQSYF